MHVRMREAKNIQCIPSFPTFPNSKNKEYLSMNYQGLKVGRAKVEGSEVGSLDTPPVVITRIKPAPGPSLRPWEAEGSIDVEQLAIWAFMVQRADRYVGVGLYAAEASAAGCEPRGRSTDGCAALGDIANLGCRISVGVVVTPNVHPVADLVASLCEDIEDGGLVSFHAGLGGRPDGWRKPERLFRPVLWKVEGQLAQSERSGRGNSPMITRVMPVTTWAEIYRRRDLYGRWWEALHQLSWRLSMRALGFVIRPPSAPQAPWLEPSA
jgi:hypothetical protein